MSSSPGFYSYLESTVLDPISKKIEEGTSTLSQKMDCGLETINQMIENDEAQVVNRDGKENHIRPTRVWKTYPKVLGIHKDFSYVKPKVDMTRLVHLPAELKEQVKEKCLLKMKESMKALDPSLVDAINTQMAEGSERLRDNESQRRLALTTFEVLQRSITQPPNSCKPFRALS